LVGSRIDEEKEVNKVQYRIAKRAVKKAMAVAKNNAYEMLHHRLDPKEGEKEVFKLTSVRDRLARDLSSVRCIKDEDGKVLTEDTKRQERWKSYFYKLFNEERFDVSQLTKGEEQHSFRSCSRTTKDEVQEALRKKKVRKAVGLDSIHVEIKKSLGEEGIEWLIEFFNVIFKTATMPQEWRHSTVIPMSKKKGDVQNCNNYRGIKLLSHTMKL